VNSGLAFDGQSYVVDTSAWAGRVRRAAAWAWSAAMPSGQLWITPVVKLELLYSTRNEAEFGEVERRLDDMREAPLDRSVTRSAVVAMRELAAIGPLHHRVPVTDALIAAAATARGIGVLHYDEHFDRLATVLGFDSRWIVPRGTA
jgi:predicted nucleic acid-binding protein